MRDGERRREGCPVYIEDNAAIACWAMWRRKVSQEQLQAVMGSLDAKMLLAGIELCGSDGHRGPLRQCRCDTEPTRQPAECYDPSLRPLPKCSSDPELHSLLVREECAARLRARRTLSS